MSGASKIAAVQSILQHKFSPGFDKLEEELRKFEGLVKTNHAVFGEGISESIAQAVIKSQMPAEITTHLELQTFTRTTELISLMSSLSEIRIASHQPERSAALGPVPMKSGWVKNKDKGKNKNKEKRKGKGKSKGKGNEKPKNENFETWCSNCRKWGHNVAKLLARKRETGRPSSRQSWHGQFKQTVVYTDGLIRLDP